MNSLGNGGSNTEARTPTGQDIEGPFYLPGAPFRTKLTPEGEAGDKIVITGKVENTDSEPLIGAIVDIWHADANGEYDFSENYWYRGQLTTDDKGCYKFETSFPGRYSLDASFRPAHIHIKGSAQGHVLLTTQLYFSDDPYLGPNDPATDCRSDDPMRIIVLHAKSNEDGSTTWTGIFNIVLEPVSATPDGYSI